MNTAVPTDTNAIKASSILAAARRTAEPRGASRDIVDLTLRESDFAPRSHVVDVVINNARSSLDYTPSNGMPVLRNTARQAIAGDHSLAYADSEIAVGCGAKQVIFNIFLATIKIDDEVIILMPYRAGYPDMVRFCGGAPFIVLCPTEDGFRLSPSALAAAITPRTRWAILNAPGNPSSTVYSCEQIGAFTEVLRGHPHVLVMSDENCAYMSVAAVAPDLRDHILLVDGVSKAYAMTGWRVGWGFGPEALIARIDAIGGQNCTQTAVYRERRDAGVAVLSGSAVLDVPIPDGVFYLFPHLIGRADDVAVADMLLKADAAFGAPGHLCLSFATDTATLEEGSACRRDV